jgi:cobalt-zinc-cadmium efflux system protein
MTMISATHNHAPESVSWKPRSRFAIAFGITLAILAIEVIAGIASHSLSLLSDAGHVVTDVFALGLSWFAATMATRPADAHNTFGYHRVGILAAMANALTLIGITIVVVIEAINRLYSPEVVNPPLMIGAALIGIMLNMLNVYILNGHDSHMHTHHDHAHTHTHTHGNDLNQRGAIAHILGDIGASVGVILGAIAIGITGLPIFDALVSIVIATLLAVSAFRIARDALNILLEATPPEIDVTNLASDITNQVHGVHRIHHIHVWSLSGTVRALSLHAIIDDCKLSDCAPLLEGITKLAYDTYGIDHTTVQFEGCQHTTFNCICGTSCECSANPSKHADLASIAR